MISLHILCIRGTYGHFVVSASILYFYEVFCPLFCFFLGRDICLNGEGMKKKKGNKVGLFIEKKKNATTTANTNANNIRQTKYDEIEAGDTKRGGIYRVHAETTIPRMNIHLAINKVLLCFGISL